MKDRIYGWASAAAKEVYPEMPAGDVARLAHLAEAGAQLAASSGGGVYDVVFRAAKGARPDLGDGHIAMIAKAAERLAARS